MLTDIPKRDAYCFCPVMDEDAPATHSGKQGLHDLDRYRIVFSDQTSDGLVMAFRLHRPMFLVDPSHVTGSHGRGWSTSIIPPVF